MNLEAPVTQATRGGVEDLSSKYFFSVLCFVQNRDIFKRIKFTSLIFSLFYSNVTRIAELSCHRQSMSIIETSASSELYSICIQKFHLQNYIKVT